MPLSGISPEAFMPQIDLVPGENTIRENKRKQFGNFQISVSTTNKFEAISDEECMDEDTPASHPIIKKTVIKTVKIPPIVVNSYIRDHTKSLKALRAMCKCDFDVKCRLTFLTKCKEDYDKILNEFKIANLEFHTYTPKNEINYTFILRNLPPNISESEIKEDLISKKLEVIKVTQMSKKELSRKLIMYPLYMVTFDKTVSINDILTNNKVCGCIINWEKYKNFSGVTQCFKCQSFNHITKNCYRKPKCLRCAEEHLTKDCVATDENLIKCTNCNGRLPANHKSCEVKLKNRTTQLGNKAAPKAGFQFNLKDFPTLTALGKQRSTSMKTGWSKSIPQQHK